MLSYLQNKGKQDLGRPQLLGKCYNYPHLITRLRDWFTEKLSDFS